MNQAEAITIKKKLLTSEERAAIVGSKRFGAVSRTLGSQFGVSTNKKDVMAYLKEKNIPQLVDWPPQSPYLNPIENLWSILDRNLQDRNPNNEGELFQQLTEGWQQLGVDLLTRLVDSMPRRIQMVLEAGGSHIPY